MYKISYFIYFTFLTMIVPYIAHAEESLPWLKQESAVEKKEQEAKKPHTSSLPKPITEGKLNPISPATIGLIDSKEGSLGNNMWTGTSGKLAEYFLTYLPTHQHSTTLKNLRYRLLTTPATPPLSADERLAGRFIELRVEQLAAMEEYDAIRHLISKLPAHSITEIIHQTLVVSLLRTKHYDKACSHAQVTIKYFNNSSWQQLMALCHILQERWNNAELSVELLKTSPVKLQTIGTFEHWIQDNYQPSESEILSLVTAIIPPVSLAIQNTDDVTLPKNLPLKLRLLSRTWWQQISNLPTHERLHKIGQFYNYLEANKHPINILYWQTALRSSATPPRSIVLRLLRDAAYKKQVGKTVSLILFATEGKPISELDTEVMSTVIRSLHSVKLHHEAYSLTQEFLSSALPNDIKPFTIQQTIN